MRKEKVFIHKSAFIDNNVLIGRGTKIWHFSHIMEGAVIGTNCKIGQNVFIGKGVIIGNNVKVQNNVYLYTGAVLEDDVFCGPSAVFTNIKYPRSAYPRNSDEFYLKTIVKKGATIGANATIICGITLGRYCFIGAGAVVTKDVFDFSMVFGVPAVVKGWICECGEKLNFKRKRKGKFSCLKCKREYLKHKKEIREIK